VGCPDSGQVQASNGLVWCRLILLALAPTCCAKTLDIRTGACRPLHISLSRGCAFRFFILLVNPRFVARAVRKHTHTGMAVMAMCRLRLPGQRLCAWDRAGVLPPRRATNESRCALCCSQPQRRVSVEYSHTQQAWRGGGGGSVQDSCPLSLTPDVSPPLAFGHWNFVRGAGSAS